MNTLRTCSLMIVLSVLLVMAGYFMDGPGGMILALVLSLSMNFFAYWYSDKLALRMAGAKEVSQEEAPDLHFIVGGGRPGWAGSPNPGSTVSRTIPPTPLPPAGTPAMAPWRPPPESCAS